MDLAAFLAHESTIYAVQYPLPIISEAARKLGAQAELLAPDQPWDSIRSIGNVLRHQYDDVGPDVIWWIVQRDLAALEAAARKARLVPSDTHAEDEPPKS